MSIIEEHRTPDGLYRFIVERGDDGDLSLGFDGFPSHTHGDILAELSGLSIDAANLVKIHGAIRCTPAMAAGVEKSAWTVSELVERCGE